MKIGNKWWLLGIIAVLIFTGCASTEPVPTETAQEVQDTDRNDAQTVPETVPDEHSSADNGVSLLSSQDIQSINVGHPIYPRNGLLEVSYANNDRIYYAINEDHTVAPEPLALTNLESAPNVERLLANNRALIMDRFTPAPGYTLYDIGKGPIKEFENGIEVYHSLYSHYFFFTKESSYDDYGDEVVKYFVYDIDGNLVFDLGVDTDTSELYNRPFEGAILYRKAAYYDGQRYLYREGYSDAEDLRLLDPIKPTLTDTEQHNFTYSRRFVMSSAAYSYNFFGLSSVRLKAFDDEEVSLLVFDEKLNYKGQHPVISKGSSVNPAGRVILGAPFVDHDGTVYQSVRGQVGDLESTIKPVKIDGKTLIPMWAVRGRSEHNEIELLGFPTEELMNNFAFPHEFKYYRIERDNGELGYYVITDMNDNILFDEKDRIVDMDYSWVGFVNDRFIPVGINVLDENNQKIGYEESFLDAENMTIVTRQEHEDIFLNQLGISDNMKAPNYEYLTINYGIDSTIFPRSITNN